MISPDFYLLPGCRIFWNIIFFISYRPDKLQDYEREAVLHFFWPFPFRIL
jgi:hypothetical protein